MQDLLATTSKYRTSCDQCLKSKVRCSRTKPMCSRCRHGGHQCLYSPLRRLGRPPKSSSHRTNNVHLLDQRDTCQDQEDDLQLQKRQGHRDGRKARYGDTKTAKCITSLSPLAHMSEMPSMVAGPKGTDLVPNMVTFGPFNASATQGRIDGASSKPNESPDLPCFEFDLTENELLEFGFSNVQLNAEHGRAYNTAEPLAPSQHSLSTLATGTCFSKTSFQHPPPGLSLMDSLLVSQSHNSRALASEPSDTTLSSINLSQSEPTARRLPMQNATYKQNTTFPTDSSTRQHLFDEQGHHLYSVTPEQSATAEPARLCSLMRTGFSLDGRHGRCSNNCYVALSDQLARLNSYSLNGSTLSLDRLLSLDRQVHQRVDKALSCTDCLERTKRRSSLMLIIMVLEHLLVLFERGAVAIADGDALTEMALKMNNPEITNMHAQNGMPANTHGSIQRGHTETLPSSSLQMQASLLAGDFDEDRNSRAMFVQHLLQHHLDKMLYTVSDLQISIGTSSSDVNQKTAHAMLLDMTHRIRYLQQ